MILYKYLSPERTDLLESFLIRFSQPSALNDPHEAILLFNREDTPKDIIRKFHAEESIYDLYLQVRDKWDDNAIWKAAWNLLGKDQVDGTTDGIIKHNLLNAIKDQPETEIVTTE
jgi:hypothetical protein